MRKTLLIVLFIGAAISGFAQKDSVKYDAPDGWTSTFAAVQGQFGVSMFKDKSLGTYIDGSLNQPLYKTGLSVTALANYSRTFYSDIHLNLEYTLPVNQTVSDTNSFKMSGFQWGLMLLGQDLLQSSWNFDCILGLGFNQGAYWMNTTDNGVTTKHRNPFFAPKGVGELRVLIGDKVTLGGRAEYQYDISKSKWKTKSGVEMPGSKFTGLSLQAVLGIAWY